MIQQKLRIQKREYGGHKRRKLNQHRLDCKYCNKKKIKGQYKPNKHSFENWQAQSIEDIQLCKH